MTDYLGFEREDGEYKVMGMAPYGDASKVNLDHIISWDVRQKTYHCSDDYVWVRRDKRSRADKVYSKKMVAEMGPERTGDDLNEPYIHIAAATQEKLEEISLNILQVYLSTELARHGNLCFSGGCALNVSLNRKLLENPLVKRLWVQPASHDAGGSLGAACYAAAEIGDKVQPMEHVYLGPAFTNEEIETELKTSGTARLGQPEYFGQSDHPGNQ
jgi:carbamoyltransferase